MLLLDVITYVVMAAYKAFGTGNSGHVLGGIWIIKYFGNHTSLKINESLKIYEF